MDTTHAPRTQSSDPRRETEIELLWLLRHERRRRERQDDEQRFYEILAHRWGYATPRRGRR